MSYVVLRKPYDPDNELSAWTLIKFTKTFKQAVRVVEQKNFDFQRGDLVVILVSDHVSDIEKHAVWLWVATSAAELKPWPQRFPEIETWDNNWIYLYRNTSNDGLIRYLDGENLISRGYAIAICYEFLLLFVAPGGVVAGFMPFLKQWLDGTLSRDEIPSIRQDFYERAMAENNGNFTGQASALNTCFNSILSVKTSRTSNFAIATGSIMYAGGSYDQLAEIVHRMVPLHQFILAITERRTFKLAWE